MRQNNSLRLGLIILLALTIICCLTAGNIIKWPELNASAGKPSSNSRLLEESYPVVIDPGHGGNDPEASGNGLVEKALTLDIGQRVIYGY